MRSCLTAVYQERLHTVAGGPWGHGAPTARFLKPPCSYCWWGLHVRFSCRAVTVSAHSTVRRQALTCSLWDWGALCSSWAHVHGGGPLGDVGPFCALEMQSCACCERTKQGREKCSCDRGVTGRFTRQSRNCLSCALEKRARYARPGLGLQGAVLSLSQPLGGVRGRGDTSRLWSSDRRSTCIENSANTGAT